MNGKANLTTRHAACDLLNYRLRMCHFNRQRTVLRLRSLVLFGLFCAAVVVRADEKLPTLTVDGMVYSNVTVTSVTATDIYFTANNGIGSAKLRDLNPALQKHFHFDTAKAGAAEPNSANGSAGNTPDQGNPQAALDDAMARVRRIVNQPVTALPIREGMDVTVYSPGWFHPGAIRPDFNTVDVRSSQELHYANNIYVTSDLNPGICFLGSELEFNSMTKFFYTDRSLPKKKLTGDEMLEINRLYRIIGQCEQKLGEQQTGGASRARGLADGGSVFDQTRSFVTGHITILASAAAGLLCLFMAILNYRKGHSEA